jgi:hypothetical protein
MDTKLTLRLEDALIRRAKEEAARRGKSVSQMVSDYFNSLKKGEPEKSPSVPPVTASLIGILRGSQVSEDDYKRHLEEKYR